MKNYYGLKGIRIYMTEDLDEANEFLKQHDGDIIDVQCSDEFFHIIYKEETAE